MSERGVSITARILLAGLQLKLRYHHSFVRSLLCIHRASKRARRGKRRQLLAGLASSFRYSICLPDRPTDRPTDPTISELRRKEGS